jgi:hypothetical protein
MSLKPGAGIVQDRAKEDIVEVTRRALKPEQRSDLRPLPHFMDEDIEHDLPRGCRQAVLPQRELLANIPGVSGECGDEGSKRLATASAQLEERIRTVGCNGSGVRQGVIRRMRRAQRWAFSGERMRVRCNAGLGARASTGQPASDQPDHRDQAHPKDPRRHRYDQKCEGGPWPGRTESDHSVSHRG